MEPQPQKPSGNVPPTDLSASSFSGSGATRTHTVVQDAKEALKKDLHERGIPPVAVGLRREDDGQFSLIIRVMDAHGLTAEQKDVVRKIKAFKGIPVEVAFVGEVKPH